MNTAAASDSAHALLRWQFRRAHELVEARVDTMRVTPTRLHPSKSLARAEAVYARSVLCEDMLVQSMLGVTPPLALSTWAGRTGLSALPSLAGPVDWPGWGEQVDVNLVALRRYARAVYRSTDAQLATLSDASRQENVESALAVLSALLLTLAMRCGEIAYLLCNEREQTTVKPCPLGDD